MLNEADTADMRRREPGTGRLEAGGVGRAGESESYLRIRSLGGRLEVSGTARLRLGHRIAVDGRDEPEGVFNEWTWDGTRLTIERDRYGLMPLYVWQGEGHIALATSIVRLLELGAPAALDELALTIFLRRGGFHGDATAFTAIRVLPAARRIVWDGSGLTVEQRTKPPPVSTLARDDAIDAFVAAFRRGIARRPSVGHVVHLLSGGRDSRHILLELVRAGRAPDEVVTGRSPLDPADSDVDTAAMLARRLGLPHVVLDAPGNVLEAERWKNLGTGFGALEHAWFKSLADHVRARAGTVYDGLGGDVLSASQYDKELRQDLFNQGEFKKLAQTFLRFGPPGAVHPYVETRLFRRDAPWRALIEAATDAVARDLMSHGDAANPVKSFIFWTRTRRAIGVAPYALYGSKATVYSPFLDTDVFDLLMSLPPAMTLDQSFHDAALARAFPEVGDIPLARAKSAAGSSGSVRRYAFDVFCRSLFPPRALGLRRSWLLPRLAVTAVDGSAERIRWLAAGSTTYLGQLLELAGRMDKRS